MPCFACRIWYMGLCWILRGLKRQQQLTDRRSRWLKDKYLQLYFEENGSSPITADAIRVFGGRDWSALTESAGTLSPTSSSTLRRRNIKGKKTKSSGNIHVLTKVRSRQAARLESPFQRKSERATTPAHVNARPLCFRADDDALTSR